MQDKQASSYRFRGFPDLPMVEISVAEPEPRGQEPKLNELRLRFLSLHQRLAEIFKRKSWFLKKFL
jgi:hypothetical protein